MTDQKHDPETSPPARACREGPAPDDCRISGLLSSPQDESLADIGGTALAPSCPAPLATAVSDVKPLSLDDIKPGSRIDDFEIISLLGRGAFGAVYLARQISLERQVALKVTAWQGGEGRKMARLEHENIVQVFSETALDSRTRLLCMQYVAGPTLQAVLDELAECPPAERSGQKLLDAVDRLVQRPAEFDPAAMRNRELLAGLDWVETVCWIGARLAEALDYAHSHGVIHRDIKPGNIMLNQYGRPLLVDFNLAFQPLDASAGGDRLGGTLAYMAPEHLEAFAPDAEVPTETIAQAADIYSLGVVLYQAASGALPFTQTPGGKNKSRSPAGHGRPAARASAAIAGRVAPRVGPGDRPLFAPRSDPAVRLGPRVVGRLGRLPALPGRREGNARLRPHAGGRDAAAGPLAVRSRPHAAPRGLDHQYCLQPDPHHQPLDEAQQAVFCPHRVLLRHDRLLRRHRPGPESRAAGSPGMAVGGRAAAGRSAADRRGAADRRDLAVVGGRDCLPLLDAGRDCLSPGSDDGLRLAGAGRMGPPADLVRAFGADRGDVFHVLRRVDHALRDLPEALVRPARISGHGRRGVAVACRSICVCCRSWPA